jgi:transcriptional regulator with XRE-family HTH domain
METMRQYVSRRAWEMKNYREVAKKAGVGEEWLKKIARNEIPNPGIEGLEKAYNYFRSLEANGRRGMRKRVAA